MYASFLLFFYSLNSPSFPLFFSSHISPSFLLFFSSLFFSYFFSYFNSFILFSFLLIHFALLFCFFFISSLYLFLLLSFSFFLSGHSVEHWDVWSSTSQWRDCQRHGVRKRKNTLEKFATAVSTTVMSFLCFLWFYVFDFIFVIVVCMYCSVFFLCLRFYTVCVFSCLYIR